MKMKDGSIYEGFFKNELYNGKGKLTMSNGNILEGNFDNGTFDE